MSQMFRYVAATIGGCIAGGITVGMVESVSSILYPPPKDLDFRDHQQMVDFVSNLPTGAFIIVALAWILGAFVAAYTAAWISGRHSRWPAMIACSFLIAATVATLSTIPHPTWMWIVGIAAYPALVLLAAFGVYALSGPFHTLIKLHKIRKLRRLRNKR